MSAELVNLRQARKRKRREEAATEAAAKRVQFGRSRAEKAGTRLKLESEEKKLEAHRRTPPDDRQGG